MIPSSLMYKSYFLCCHTAAYTNIKFCLRVGKTAARTYEMPKTIYKNDNLLTCLCMFRNIWECDDLKDDLMGGQPSTAGNLEKVVKIHELAATDQQNDAKFDGGSNAHELKYHSSNLS